MDRRAFLATACSLAFVPLWSRADSAATLSRRLRWTLTINNPSAVAISDTNVWAYAPVAATQSQQVQELSVSGNYQLLGDSVGNSIVQLHYDTFPPFATKVVSFSATLAMRISPLASPLLAGNPWLADEPYVESAAEEIRALAKRLAGANPAQTAQGIYEWVKSNIDYVGYIPQDMGALYALRERRGDCTEYAYLVTALARAAGIPARCMGGYVVSADAVLKATDYHNWAELYLDGFWVLVDSQKGTWGAHSRDYVAFEVISATKKNVLVESHRYAATKGLVVNWGA